MADMKLAPHEEFTGRMIRVPGGEAAALLLGRGRSSVRGALIHQGHVEIYFAFPLLYATDFVFPQSVLDEFRRTYNGRAAVDFMLNKGNSYPRADVAGIRLSDGQRIELFLKEIDVGAGLCAFAFPAGLVGQPLARLDAVIWLDESASSVESLSASGEDADSLLALAVRRFRCSPALLPGLYRQLGAGHRA